MKKEYVSWKQLEGQIQEIIRQMSMHNWRPDYIVGLTRGGLLPAKLISSYMDIRMETLRVSLRDHEGTESNGWMAEDAIGYDMNFKKPVPANRKKILIVDDINDSGATLNWVKEDWERGAFPGYPEWENIWGDNIRVATLYDNLSSEFKNGVDYSAKEINKAEDDVWVVFPWEKWWQGNAR